MRIIGVLILLSASFVSRSQTIIYQRIDPPGFAATKISKKGLIEDVRFWHKVMEESHVNLYHAISKKNLLAMESGLLAKVKDSISQTDALLLFGKLAASLNEGHIGLPSSSASDNQYVNSLRFPYLVKKVTDSAWIIMYDLSAEQKLGANAKILAINGVSIYHLNKKYQQYFGGLPAWRKQEIGSYARKLLFLDGMKSPYTISAVKEDGTKVNIVTNGYSKQQADSISKTLNNNQAKQPDYTFEWRDNDIAYINYRHMVNTPDAPFDQFLEKSFAAIKEKNAKGLIIDLRENGGGNSAYGEMMLSYINEKPYRFAGGLKWKVSSHFKEFIRKSGNDDTTYTNRKDGFMFTYNGEAETHPAKDLLYKGKVVVLIGPDTFSSANMFADGIKSFQLAYIIGEPTAEPPNDFGEMLNFMLPNTHLIARASTKMFTRANGDEKDFNPVIPDKIVKLDEAYDEAVKWIKKR